MQEAGEISLFDTILLKIDKSFKISEKKFLPFGHPVLRQLVV
jgi:hypothetical protein